MVSPWQTLETQITCDLSAANNSAASKSFETCLVCNVGTASFVNIQASRLKTWTSLVVAGRKNENVKTK